VSRRKAINFGVTFLQVTLLTILFILEYLSGYKAGLAQHLYFKKVHYLAQYYQGVPLVLHGILLLMLALFAVKQYIRTISRPIFSCTKFAILLLATIFFFFSHSARNLNVYAHTLMVLELCLVLEFSALMVTRRTT